MAKSKRAKVVPLTHAKKKTRDDKERIVQLVRDCVDEFPHAYVFRFENMRNATLKGLRDTLRGTCRFFLGSNKVLQVALGREAAGEHRPGLAALAARLRGDAGLLFTNLPRSELEVVLSGATVAHTAKAGVIPSETHTLPPGPLFFRGDMPFPHTNEAALRAAGVPSRLRAGVVELLGEHVVCSAGAPLSRNQAAVAKMLELKLATFSMALDSVWDSASCGFEVISEPEEAGTGAEAAHASLMETFGHHDDGNLKVTEAEIDSDDERAVGAAAKAGGGRKASRGGGGGAAKAKAKTPGKAAKGGKQQQEAMTGKTPRRGRSAATPMES